MSERADDLTFASAYIGTDGHARIHYARCESCMWGQHDGGRHDWAGLEDVEHAKATGQPDPTGQRCACDCYDQPPVHEVEPPDFDEESLNAAPCPVCGEAGACEYDADGRPMIHADFDPTEESP